MSYGTPVIAARAASLPEVLGEGALYIDPYDTEDMAAAMAKLTEDASLRQSLSEKGLIQCSRYDWGRTAKEIMERMVGLIC